MLATPTNLLIVDDNTSNVGLLRHIFDNDYLVDTAQSGTEALERVAANPPDIILLDVMMPEMDGLEVCRRVRADPAHRFIKIIMVSALTAREQRLAGYNAGADDYVTKPFVRDELAAKVRVFAKLKFAEEADHALRAEHARQEELISKLKEAQGQLLQSEKMASIGQLAAGVAHEINNPVGYVASNLSTLRGYVADLLEVIAAYEKAEEGKSTDGFAEVTALKRKLDLDFLRGDLTNLLAESLEGLARVKKIVQDLKEFSHVDSAEWLMADLHAGLDSTLNIVHNELKYKCTVVKDYGVLPEVECIASQINQVFMNMLVNAAHAIETRGTITIRSGAANGEVWVSIADTGKGMTPDVMKRIFDPFFTTKPVGKGTGLGLSLAWNIVQKHHGRIEVESEPDKGTRFRICLPVRQPEQKAAHIVGNHDRA